MNTEISKSKHEITVFKDMNATSAKPIKKLTQPIKTEAFSDKENFKIRSCVPITDGEIIKSKSNNEKEDLKKKLNKKITAEDLASEESSGKYWEMLAEERRKVLKEALTENSYLYEKMELLKKQKVELEEALINATEIIEYLKEEYAEYISDFKSISPTQM